MKIGETILKLREEKKMSQEEFAQYFHVTRQTISNWEKEKSFPDLETLVEISDAAGVSVDAMLRGNHHMVRQIDRKVRHFEMFRRCAIVLAVIVLAGGLYTGVQSVKRGNIIQTFETKLNELGFEKNGNDYCLDGADFKYEIYTFEKPPIWKWNQERPDSEKFIAGTYTGQNASLEEDIDIQMRKTEDFTTFTIIKGNYKEEQPQVIEYFLDESGQLKHMDKVNKEDREIYEKLQSEIKKAADKMDEIYSEVF